MAGDGLQRAEIAELVDHLGLQQVVTVMGVRDDIGQLMHAADAFVLSSKTEALPLVLLEAAASRLPIVTTDVGGCREIVLHGISGFVVPPSDAIALRRAMQHMMALSEEERGAMEDEGAST